MEAIGVLMTYPINAYLEEELNRRYNLFRFWHYPDPGRNQYLAQHADSIRAIVACGRAGAGAELIDALPNLEIVSSHSVGLDKIDLGRCKQRGIRVTYTPDVLTDDVADLAIGLIIDVLMRISNCDRHVRDQSWQRGDIKLTTKFSGKRVGIIGLGRIGAAIARRAEAFSCPVSYHSRNGKPDSRYTYYHNAIELASNCDVLVVACALSEETRHIVNREVINALGPKGILVNIGRGLHIDESELVAALVEGRLGGSGLDVFEREPDVPEELFGLENVVLSAHAGANTVEARTTMADLVLANLDAHFHGEPLLTPVLL